MVMTTPMVHALRLAQPSAHICVVAGSDSAAEVIRGSRLCEEVQVMSFRRSSMFTILRFFVRLRMQQFDVAFIASGLSPKIALGLKFLSGVRTVVGDGGGAKGWGYTHWRRVDNTNHRVMENAEILKLALPNCGIGDLHFEFDEQARTEAARIWTNHHLDTCDVLGVHPGGQGSECPDKQIPQELCREVVQEYLARDETRRVVLFFGPDETGLIKSYDWGLERVIILSGLRLTVVAATIGKCQAVLSGDTGLGHIAAAVGTPVVTVAGPTDIVNTRPWGNKHRVVQTEKRPDCMPCYQTVLYGKCPHGQECMRSIDAAEVLKVLMCLDDRQNVR